MQKSSNTLRLAPATAVEHGCVYSLSGAESDEEFHTSGRADRATAGRDDLPYRVELWNDARQDVDQVLAVTARGSIGYAAYYAAMREYPDRYITLRHENSILSRWNEPDH